MAKYIKSKDAFGNTVEVGNYVMFASVGKTEMGRQQTIKESKFVTGKVVGFTKNHVKILKVNLQTLETEGRPQYRLPEGIGKVEIVDEKA